MAELLASGSSYGNQFTISRQGDVDAITGKTWNGIIKNYQFVIDQISKRVRWQGTMDFAVDVVTGNGHSGNLTSMAWQYAYDKDGLWVHSATAEQQTGIDLNADLPDLGFYLVLARDGSLRNDGKLLWIDPNPRSTSLSRAPSGRDDLASIITHELFHAFGIAYDTAGYYLNKFSSFVVKNGSKNYFSGPSAIAVFGRPVPLTDMKSSNSYDHLDLVNGKSSIATVMPRSANIGENWRKPSELDFAILKDIGWNVI